MDNFIAINDVSFEYRQSGRPPLLAVRQVSLAIASGRHVVILGRNGSGKSTLARLVNALEIPTEGTIVISGRMTADENQVWEIRRLCGMVFQNPDNQIVGTTVEEDVAFGPENLGFAQPDIRRSVDKALETVGLSDQAQRPPHLLSGGQKQKLAIAGILAMQPSCLILDEATSMLDPLSRREFMALVQDLIARQNLTVINITHLMEEALLADEVHVMNDGQIVLSGAPAIVFDQVDLLKAQGLDIPVHIEIAHLVARSLQQTLQPLEATSWSGAVAAVRRMIGLDGLPKQSSDTTMSCEQPAQTGSGALAAETALPAGTSPRQAEAPAVPAAWAAGTKSTGTKSPVISSEDVIIRVSNLSYTYTPGTAIETAALRNVSFDVRKGELLGIVGHSGSGKSTLIQHLNGLLRAQQGQVMVMDLNASANKDIRQIRQRVGLLFQYPEHQLFEETVFLDIAFGPRRMGLDMNDIEQRVLWAAGIVGLQEEDLDRSPFELSGGQKRRAAIAGVIAMKPDVLILDEPAAGLDPAGRDEILGYAAALRQQGTTVILVSHSMEDVSRLADRVLVLRAGQVHLFGDPAAVFTDDERLTEAGLAVPRPVAFLREFLADFPDMQVAQFTAAAAASEIERIVRQAGYGGNVTGETMSGVGVIMNGDPMSGEAASRRAGRSADDHSAAPALEGGAGDAQ